VRFVNIKCRVLDYIGKESLNFYLFQLALLTVLLDYFNGWCGYGVALFAMTGVLSLIYSKLVYPIICKLRDNNK